MNDTSVSPIGCQDGKKHGSTDVAVYSMILPCLQFLCSRVEAGDYPTGGFIVDDFPQPDSDKQIARFTTRVPGALRPFATPHGRAPSRAPLDDTFAHPISSRPYCSSCFFTPSGKTSSCYAPCHSSHVLHAPSDAIWGALRAIPR